MGKAEWSGIDSSESLKGRMLRRTPGFGGIWRFHRKIHFRENSFPFHFAKILFGNGCFWSWPDGVRCIREQGCGYPSLRSGSAVSLRIP